MRNYVAIPYVRIEGLNTVGTEYTHFEIGLDEDNALAMAQQWVSLNHPITSVFTKGKAYFRLDRKLIFGALCLFPGTFWLGRRANGNPLYTQNMINWDSTDFVDLDSPRHREKRKFKLVPLRKGA